MPELGNQAKHSDTPLHRPHAQQMHHTQDRCAAYPTPGAQNEARQGHLLELALLLLGSHRLLCGQQWYRLRARHDDVLRLYCAT